MTKLINGRTPEEIKERLDAIIKINEFTNLALGVKNDATIDTIRETLAYIERLESRIAALEAAQPRWIGLSETTKPTDSGNYLVMVEMFGYLREDVYYFSAKNGEWYGHGSCEDSDAITHWMPLPEPPEEETE